MPLSRSLTVCVTLVGIAFTALLASAHRVAADDRPNIIYIMSDDMGYSDIGCYGSEIDTPNLNRLADNGLRFTQFYNTARCCPTRASLLTGLYPHQAGIGHMMQDRGHDGYRGDLNRQSVTIAEVLKAAGYRTYMSGKWHVTKTTAPQNEADKHNWPRQRGFDRFYGTIHGAGSFFDPNTLTRDNQFISPITDPLYPTEQYYYTDAIADHASRYIQDHHQQTGDQPFFLYVSFTAAHWPMHAKPADIAKYRGKYDAGYDAIRDARYQRMLELGVIDAASTVNWPIPAAWKETKDWEWDKRNMEVYAAMIDSMDQGIGRILETLQATGQYENTLICFLQDNGGCAETYGRGGQGPQRADKPSLPRLPDDYLQPDMQPKQTRDGYPVRTGKGVMAGPADTYIGYGRGWATVSNTPFREYKHWVHEGGISTPLIMHWPAKMSRGGELESTPGHLIDLMATAVDAAEAAYPQTFHDDQPIKPMEGKSLLPTLAGEPIERDAIYWEHEGNRAVRMGDFKLVAKGAKGRWELYNIATDRSEQQDLSEQYPQRVAQLAAMWDAYARRANVLPLNPRVKRSEEFNTKQRRFELKHGDQVSRNQGPYVQQRGFNVAVTADIQGDGVLVAQGGTSHGWSLYVRNGKLRFALTAHGKRSTLDTKLAVSGPSDIQAALAKDGRLSVTVSGQPPFVGELPSIVVEQPLDELQVGRDDKGPVGDYPVGFPLKGTVKRVVIEVDHG
ncbi:arylsulfatase [Roseimaritima ulvae]|uniref:Arylsulfatase n=1 Tax=Roseimaritima ulvae TaxID=980254 RepID=A0A5B9QVG1_9BACT|nr:arylsulfatase [Roseimaritima ulvae]QEG43037.1 Arylsulfatase [Roseimaritima ulvae]